MNIQKIREDFPILKKKIKNKPIVYFDNAASSQKPQQVIDSIVQCYTEKYANVHRGVHYLSQAASEIYEKAHDNMADFLNAKGREEIVFTKNITEGINLIAYSLLMGDYFNEDSEIVLTEFEHHSNLIPWQLISQKTGAELKFIRTKSDGTLDMEDAKSKITNNVKFVSVVHVSNFLGTINPIKELSDLAHERGAILFVDSAQGTPHMPVDVRKIGCDILGYTCHKMLGPTGIGGIYIKKELGEKLEPFLRGGDMIGEVKYTKATWNRLPFKFEAGTPPIAQAAGLISTIEYLENIGMKHLRKHEKELISYTLDRFEELKDVEIYGPLDPEKRGGLVSFNLKDLNHHDVAALLDERENIMVRSGHHCVMPMHRKLGLDGSVRASYHCYNTKEEVDLMIDILKEVSSLR